MLCNCMLCKDLCHACANKLQEKLRTRTYRPTLAPLLQATAEPTCKHLRKKYDSATCAFTSDFVCFPLVQGTSHRLNWNRLVEHLCFLIMFVSRTFICHLI